MSRFTSFKLLLRIKSNHPNNFRLTLCANIAHDKPLVSICPSPNKQRMLLTSRPLIAKSAAIAWAAESQKQGDVSDRTAPYQP
ncbi:MAG TPA: hypothetical protein DC047_13525 [Blastocatellia bacterium]|nr:hypothetical protein [Blastocatellia bacterium]